MYAQAAIKQNTLLRNGAYGIVMRGVQKCTCAGSSLRGRNSAPLCCIKLDTATDWSYQAVDSLVASGIMLPRNGYNFEPKALATRAEVAQVLSGLLTFGRSASRQQLF